MASTAVRRRELVLRQATFVVSPTGASATVAFQAFSRTCCVEGAQQLAEMVGISDGTRR